MNTENFKGFFRKNSGLTTAYAISILGLAGIPITSGFIAKIYLFSGIAKSGLIFIPVLIILMLLTVAALFYYLKILLPLFEENDSSEQPAALKCVFSQKFVLTASAIVVLVLGICPEKLIELCQFIAYNI